MTVYGRRGTPAMRAAHQPQPTPVYTQTQVRKRRRQRLPVRLDGKWSLRAELVALITPLAERAATSPTPLTMSRSTEYLIEATHVFVSDVAALVARADAEKATRHIGVDQRGRSIVALVDLAPRPQRPDLSDEDIISGGWGALAIAMADAYDADLSRVLGANQTGVASDRVLRGLVDLDQAVAAFARRLDADQRARARAAAAAAVPTEADKLRAELLAQGVSI